MALLVRKRRADGSLGEFVKVFDGETQEEVLERIKEDNQELKAQIEDLTSVVSILLGEDIDE